jgi:MerR family transcriptional regulator, thiopeptide resistance regulator
LKPRTPTSYRVHEFAATAGVTVRALHHYDRLGLLKPTHRSERGYRLYSDSDLARLEQIVVLKFLGLPLKQIRELLKDKSDLPGKLRRQQQVLVEKRRQLDRAIQAIRKAEKSLQSKREPDWKIFRRILKEIEMQNNTDWTQKYYSEAAQAKIEKRKTSWSPELQAQVSKDWAELFADIEASLNEDPASPKAQALAARWKKLVHGFTGGDPEVQKGLNAMYADRANWPTEPKKNWQIRPEFHAFIRNAMKAGTTS